MGLKTHGHRHVNRYFLKASDILKYLLGNDDKMDTLIMCKTSDSIIQTTDNELYRAFGSLRKCDEVERARITKFFESVQITSSPKRLLTHEEVEELRKESIKIRGDY